jgi:streptogramin lyase
MSPARIKSFAALIALLLALAPLPAVAGSIVVGEASLGPSGKPYQANLAPDGHLLVSIDVADQIWRIDPVTGAYTIYKPQYPDQSNLSDAHQDGAGNIWFADWTFGKLGRISGSNVTLWTLPSEYPWGVAIDGSGQVWVTDVAFGTLYRFKPGAGMSGQLTCYSLPAGGVSTYVLASGSNLWLGDALNERILRVALAAGNPGQVTVWEVPGAEPEGMALDHNGRLWWADTALNQLARLVPDDVGNPLSDPVTFYTPPVGGSNPVIVQVSGDSVWYSDNGIGTLGLLDPTLAGSANIQASVSTASLSEVFLPGCGTTVTGSAGSMQIANGSLSPEDWTRTLWASVAQGNGWNVYGLPTGGKPYGIALVGDSPWVVDQGRRKLSVLGAALSRSIFLPLAMRQ